MAATNLVGTLPDQIPTNADLGDLAFQNKDSINVTGGRAALEKLDITSFSNYVNLDIVDLFVYDTSKDSDKGAWRTRCQHTSWYNEELNTAWRGSRREFPNIAIIAVATNDIYIFDGDDSNLSMWKVITRINNGATYIDSKPNTVISVYDITSVCMLNGLLCFTQWRSGGALSALNTGVGMLNFPKDEVGKLIDYGYFVWDTDLSTTGVNYGNNNYQVPGYTGLPSTNCFDVDMAVVGAPVLDPQTGLAIPTIAVATGNGLAVHHPNKSTSSYQNTYEFKNVSIDPARNIVWGHSVAGGGDIIHYVPLQFDSFSLGETTAAYTLIDRGWSGTYNVYNMRPRDLAGTKTGLAISDSDNARLLLTAGNFIRDLNIGAGSWQQYGTGLRANIYKDSNSGWMPGDPKLAVLNETNSTGIVNSGELITNGGFDSGTTGWTINLNSSTGGSVAVSGGQLTFTQGSNSVWLEAYQEIATVPGEYYSVTVKLSNSGSENWNIIITGSTGTIGNWGYDSQEQWPLNKRAGYYTYQFKADALTTRINVRQGGGPTIVGTLDNVSCRIAARDQSEQGGGMLVVGTLNKTQVASGAELTSYSGFSSGNYLYQENNYFLDSIGTGDFYVNYWVYLDSVNAGEYLFEKSSISDPSNNRFEAFVVTGGIQHAVGVGSVIGNNYTMPISTGKWYNIALVKRGQHYYLYRNGSLMTSSYHPGVDHSDINSRMVIGARAYYSPIASYATAARLALFKIGRKAPSAYELAKIYRDESKLFQKDAKATIYGSGTTIGPLAYDRERNQVHIGTDSGRSVFNELVRVDNTTTGITAAISVVDGYVAED